MTSSAQPVSEDSPVRALDGWTAQLAFGLGLAIAVYALYWVVGIVAPHIYRPSFLLLALSLAFLRYPGRPGAGVGFWDWLLIALVIAALGWPMVDASQFSRRVATPAPIDLTLGGVLVLLVLEAARRTVGPVLPITAVGFLVYAVAGPWLDRIGLSLVAHRGYSIERIIGTLYMTLEGILGVPLDVAATYIVLFTIYGAVVEYSGAGRFFVEWAMALVGRSRSGSGPGRTVAVAGYLLGAVSGSGVANTVMLGAVSWPMMRRAGYPPDTAGAILAAAGIGAILAPPVMGAAAFLIAEFLNISYAEVIAMAVVPAFLYYLAIVLTVEADSKRLVLTASDEPVRPIGEVTREGWPYFGSLVAIAAAMAWGVTAFRAVFWATIVAAAVSLRSRTHALWPRRLAAALAAGGGSVVPVVATTAAAGIIVGIVTLTGLGLKAATVIVTLAGGQQITTIVYAALAVWVLGLAVPVTACYIIAAVMVAPALTQVGVDLRAAHLFVFYYAVLSEVSPPTALSPFAAAALTGGRPFRTTMLTWKYSLPAFLVPFVFTLGPNGSAILLRAPVVDVIWVSAATAIGLAAIIAGTSGSTRRGGPGGTSAVRLAEQVGLTAGGALLLVTDPRAAAAGLVVVAAIVVWRRRAAARPA